MPKSDKKKNDDNPVSPIRKEADMILTKLDLLQFVDQITEEKKIKQYNGNGKYVEFKRPMVLVTFKGVEVSKQQEKLGMTPNLVGCGLVQTLLQTKPVDAKKSTMAMLHSFRDKEDKIKDYCIVFYPEK